MRELVVQQLRRVEEEQQVSILFAVESGSRAWGFESPDSDYDIRFVYKRNIEEYLRIWPDQDTIEYFADSDIDGAGWDVKKATSLLAKSNGSLLVWLFSPIMYLSDGTTIEDMRTLAQSNFSPLAGFHHYQGMYKKFHDSLHQNKVQLKSFFYAARAAISAQWIAQKGVIPPVDFRELYAIVPEEFARQFDMLIDEKAGTKEAGARFVPSSLVQYVREVVQYNADVGSKIPAVSPNKQEFESFLKKVLM